ncbi:MAG: hypothetical protein R6V32_06755 [Bacteroidales bacterium]
MKNRYFVLLISVVILACNNQKTSPDKDAPQINESRFFWKPDSLGDIYFKHAAMLLPVDFDQDKTSSQSTYVNFFMGINNNLIYEHYAPNLGDIIKASDSTPKAPDYLQLVDGRIGDIPFNAEKMPVINKSSGINDSIIGQISLDYFMDDELLVNFNERYIQTCNKFPWSDTCHFETYDIYLDRKIILPVTMHDKTLDFLLNPQSALFVVFNPDAIAGPVATGNQTWAVPDTRTVDDANPAFDGILGYAFLKDKCLLLRPGKKQICVLDTIPE